MTRYYPVFLDLDGRRVVVVGGGAVAARKVAGLLSSGARVTVISPDLCPQLEAMAARGEVEVQRRPYRRGDLEGAYLAVIGTDDTAVNRAAAAEARAARVLVNTVDDVEYCDFIAPAVVERGDLILAISTNGRSPAMARFLREELERLIPPEYGSLLEVLERVRRELRRRGITVSPEAWQRHIDAPLREMVHCGALDEAADALLAALAESARQDAEPVAPVTIQERR